LLLLLLVLEASDIDTGNDLESRNAAAREAMEECLAVVDIADVVVGGGVVVDDVVLGVLVFSIERDGLAVAEVADNDDDADDVGGIIHVLATGSSN
jgi:hypothetical protein